MLMDAFQMIRMIKDFAWTTMLSLSYFLKNKHAGKAKPKGA